jgi:hypothetical protein
MAGFVEGLMTNSIVLQSTCELSLVDAARSHITLTPEAQTTVPLKFPEFVVQQTLDDACAGGIDDAEDKMMQGFDGRNSIAVAGLSMRLTRVREADNGDEGKGKLRKHGFGLAHRIIRYALAETGQTVPAINDELIRDYEAHMRTNPELLSVHILRDYGNHDTVTNFLDNNLNSEEREGAMMAFVLFRRLANPAGMPLNIPHRQEAGRVLFDAVQSERRPDILARRRMKSLQGETAREKTRHK